MSVVLEVLRWAGLYLLSMIGVFAFGGLVGLPFAIARARRERNRAAEGGAGSSAGRIRSRLRRLATPTLLLIPAGRPVFSKLGGDPELPIGVAWPPANAGLRTFLAQIDLAEARKCGGPAWLPETGRIYAFYDPDQHGARDVVTITYATTEPGSPVVPSGVPRWRFPERRVTFEARTSIPSPEWLSLDRDDLRELDEGFWKDIDELVDTPPSDEMQHRIGGYPNEIQDAEMPLECEHLARNLPPPTYGEELSSTIKRASREWRLLLQIDSDPDLKMNWGDAGRLYVFMRERHARTADFSKTVSIWQCY